MSIPGPDEQSQISWRRISSGSQSSHSKGPLRIQSQHLPGAGPVDVLFYDISSALGTLTDPAPGKALASIKGSLLYKNQEVKKKCDQSRGF